MIPFLGFGIWVLGVQQYFGSSEKVSEHYFQDHKYNTQLLLTVWGQDLDYKIWQWVDYLKTHTKLEEEVPFMALVYGDEDEYKTLYLDELSDKEDLTKSVDSKQTWFSGVTLDGQAWVAKKVPVADTDKHYLAYLSAESFLVPQISNQVNLFTNDGRYLLSHQKDYIGRSVPTPWTSTVYADQKEAWLDQVAIAPLYPKSDLFLALDMSYVTQARANDFYLYLLGFFVFAFLTYLLAKQEQISDQQKLVEEFFEPQVDSKEQDQAQVKVLESEFNDLHQDILFAELEPVVDSKPQVQKINSSVKAQEPVESGIAKEIVEPAPQSKKPDEWKSLISELSAELDEIEIRNELETKDPNLESQAPKRQGDESKSEVSKENLGVAFQSFAKNKKRRPKKSKKPKNLKVRSPRVEI